MPTSKPPTKTKRTLQLEKSAGAVVYSGRQNTEYLLVRAHAWGFPKGLVNPQESDEAAAVREVREETGIGVTLVPGFRESVQYFYRHKNDGVLVKKQVVYFLGRAHAREYKISWEHEEARWANLEQALELIPYENARKILVKANEFLKSNDEDFSD